MKTISIKEARSSALKVMAEAEERRRKFYDEVEVAVLEEDIEEELLRQCRQHVQFLCDDLTIYDEEWENREENDWAEAGEQVYAEWRGWL